MTTELTQRMESLEMVAAGLAHEEVDGEPLSVIEFTRRRGGKLAFTLVDGSVVVLPDPRAK